MSYLRFQQFIEDGQYRRYKSVSEVTKLLKNSIRDDLINEDINRVVWKECGVVGKLRTINRYEYNHLDMNEYLFDLGVLPMVSSVKEICLKEEEKRYLCELSKTKQNEMVHFYPARLISLGSNSDFKLEPLMNDVSTIQKVYHWNQYMELKETLEKNWEDLLFSLRGWLKRQETSRIKSKYGTVALKSMKLYCPKDVLELYGKDVLLKSSRVNFEKLKEYAAKGFFEMSEVKRFRKVINVEQHFLLMKLEKEENCKNWFNQRSNKLSELSRERCFELF